MLKLYADYDFYLQEYGNGMQAEEFDRYIRDASAYIRRLTLRKSDNFSGEELKYAVCAVAEAYWEFDRDNPNGKIVTSENNDGFSQSFAVEGKSFEKAKADKAYIAAKMWLSGTGLLSRRAKCLQMQT